MLSFLLCSQTSISNLDLSENVNIEYLILFSNQLNTIDVTNNPLLISLDIGDNQISNIDLSQNPLLNSIYANENQLTSISFNNNPMMDWIVCSNNQIEEIDISQIANIRYFDLSFNSLQTVNIKNGNNTFIQYLNVSDNDNLSCIEVDDVNYANSQSNWYKDSTASYAENCELGIMEITDEFLITIYPIPIKNSFFIDTKSNAKMKVEISSITGVNIFSKEIDANTAIDLSRFHSGIYIVNIQQENHNSIKRIIKQ
jgi:hypothetical protein